MKNLILILAVATGLPTFAASVNVWEGPGALFDQDGNPAGTYNLVVENTKTGTETQSVVSVTLPDGTVQKHECKIIETGTDSWASLCDHGSGGGGCFGEGLCSQYEEDANGHAFATTIIFDGPSEMRLLRTELQNGKAVHFFREKLHKR